MSHTSFRVNIHSIVCLNVKELLARSRRHIWLWVRITFLSIKLRMWRLLRAKSSLTFRQTIEYRFTLRLVRNMIITYSQIHRADKWLSFRLRTKWLWVRITVLSDNFVLHCNQCIVDDTIFLKSTLCIPLKKWCPCSVFQV